jgi:hypothetical protein
MTLDYLSIRWLLIHWRRASGVIRALSSVGGGLVRNQQWRR